MLSEALSNCIHYQVCYQYAISGMISLLTIVQSDVPSDVLSVERV